MTSSSSGSDHADRSGHGAVASRGRGASAARERREVISPWDERPVGEVRVSTPDDLERALATAERLFRDRNAWIPTPRRVEILERAARILAERTEGLARLALSEGGKPLVDSRVEAVRAAESVRCAVDVLRTDAGRVVPMDVSPASAHRFAATRREPVGPVVAVSAFNHPLNLIAHQVGPAVATGCPVIVKPDERTPLSCRAFLAILAEAGLPEGWAQMVVTADHAATQAVVSDPRVAFLSFIGSAPVGWMLRSRLAPGARCALEHGGAAPVIVAADADLDAAVPAIARGGFYHAGQVCVSVQRVFAERSVAAELTERLAAAARAMPVGDPSDERTRIGPMIRPSEVGRVGEWVREAVAGGARAVCGGEAAGRTTFAATVLLDPPADARVSRLEVFGPVVCVTRVDSVDDGVARANAVPFPFQAAVFTRSLDTAMRVWNRIDASAVMVNDHTAFRVDWMPFGGLRRSGQGVGGIPGSMHDMQADKMLVVQSREL